MQISMNLPSRQWTSFDGWDYNGMKERLQATLDKIHKPALLRHAERIKGQKVVMCRRPSEKKRKHTASPVRSLRWSS